MLFFGMTTGRVGLIKKMVAVGAYSVFSRRFGAFGSGCKGSQRRTRRQTRADGDQMERFFELVDESEKPFSKSCPNCVHRSRLVFSA